MKKRLLVPGLIALAIASGWLWLEHTTRPAARQASPATDAPRVVKTAPVPTLSGTAALPQDEAAQPRPTTEFAATTQAPAFGTAPVEPLAPATPTAGDILAEPDEDLVRVAKKLSVLVRDDKAPMAEREEALAHALNLSAGNEAEVLTPLVTDPALPDPFAETILSEALNRPLAYQADLYLAALAVRKTPEMQTLIREHLAFLTGGEDLGADPKAWTVAIANAKKDWE